MPDKHVNMNIIIVIIDESAKYNHFAMAFVLPAEYYNCCTYTHWVPTESKPSILQWRDIYVFK